MGYGELRRVSTLTKNIPSTSNFQHQPQQQQQQIMQQPSSSSGIETISAVVGLPRVKSRSNLPTELKRRSSSHRRSIYSIDFDIDELKKDDSTTGTTPSTKPPPPPDGGYGWVVVIAVHIIQALSMGFLTSLGIFYIEWREYFDASATRVGLAVSMSSLVLGITSPLAVGITGIVGSRPLVISGALVVFVGLVATSYATNITQLTFTVGVISAFGYGMVSSPSVLAIVDYFDVNFALANGIAFSGVSIGQLIFPPMSVEFINWFGGWRGAMFVISALVLNMAVCGALLRPVKNVKARKKSKKEDKSATAMTTTMTNTSFPTSDSENGLSYNYSSSSTSCYHSNCHYEEQFKEVASSTPFENPQFDSNANCCTTNAMENTVSSVATKRYIKKSISFARYEAVTITPTDSLEDSVFEEDSEDDNDSPIMFTASTHVNDSLTEDNEHDQSTSNSPSISTEFNDQPCEEINKLPIPPNEFPILTLIVCDATGPSIMDATTPKMIATLTKENFPIKKLWEKFKDTSMKIVSFLAKSYGIPGVFLVPVCHDDSGNFELGNRLVRYYYLPGCPGYFCRNLCTCSASTFLICFVTLFPIVAILATIQGMTAGIANTLSVVIIKTFAKPNYEESAMAMLYLIWGIGDLTGGVVAGYLYDVTGDYNVAFYFAGSAIAFTTILFYVTCVFKNRIILNLYEQYQQGQLEKGGNSADRLDEMTTINEHNEEYDNPAFKMEDESAGVKEEETSSQTSVALADDGIVAENVGHVVYHFETRDSCGNDASRLQDTMGEIKMGFGKRNDSSSTFSNTMNRKLSAPDFQQQRRASMVETVSGVLRKSTSTSGIPNSITTSNGFPKSSSKPELPPQLKRRRSSHRRSIYSIEFEIEAGGADDSSEPRCPDGGYGWVVVMAVHLIQVMGMGFLTSLGIFYIEWQEYFDSSAAAAGLVVSLSSLVLGITSPLAVGIAGLVGPRPLVIAGTVVVFLGLLATAYAQSITQLMFTVGVLTAFGYGIVISPAVLVVGDYFEEKFSLANGITFSGVSIGQLIWPPLTVELISRFGSWRGAIFIISAIVLNIAVCGALLRPVKKKKSAKIIPKFKAVETVKSTAIVTSFNSSYGFEEELKYTLPIGSKSTATLTSFNSVNEDDLKFTVAHASTSTSTSCSHEYSTKNTSHYMKRSVSFATSFRATELSEFQTDDTITDVDGGIVFTATPDNVRNRINDTDCNQNLGMHAKSQESDSIGILTNIPLNDEPSSSKVQNEFPILNVIVCDSKQLPLADSNPTWIDSEQDIPLQTQRFWRKFKDIMTKIISFLAKSYGIPGVFLSPLYVMMIPAIICLGTGWYATITYQAARAISAGISEADASFLLSLMGIGSLVGRAGHGWFVDKGFVTNEMLLVLCLGTCSVSTYLICFMTLFPVVALLATIQGMAMGIANTLCLGIMKTFAKPNFEETAVGMLYCIWGVGDLIGGVVAGYLYDLTGDYNVAFYFAGSAFALTMIQVYLTCVLKDRIIAKLYAKFQLRKMQRENSIDELDDVKIESAEEYDNPVFEDEEKDFDGLHPINEENISGCVIVQLEKCNSSEKGHPLEDTSV
ncbi:uncharacterized protein [Amphiura filiformis]|uniref:uncharacterized protein n=1 Tax=Amphiura filiformis TaxID=82378 RepID=UPI003B21FF64